MSNQNYVLIWTEKKKMKSEIEENRLKISQLENYILRPGINFQEWDRLMSRRNTLMCRNHQIKKALLIWEETGHRLGYPEVTM